MSSKKLHSEKRKAIIWCSVRVSSETRKLAEGILKTANDKETGRKIKLDELLQTGLGLIQQGHIERLQENSLTHEDRKEILRQKYIAARGPISKDEFTGFMMTRVFRICSGARGINPCRICINRRFQGCGYHSRILEFKSFKTAFANARAEKRHD